MTVNSTADWPRSRRQGEEPAFVTCRVKFGFAVEVYEAWSVWASTRITELGHSGVEVGDDVALEVGVGDVEWDADTVGLGLLLVAVALDEGVVEGCGEEVAPVATPPLPRPPNNHQPASSTTRTRAATSSRLNQ
ncbi:MAG: hypothetical protein ACXVXG_17335 [Nocardioidaceae bacterium]